MSPLTALMTMPVVLHVVQLLMTVVLHVVTDLVREIALNDWFLVTSRLMCTNGLSWVLKCDPAWCMFPVIVWTPLRLCARMATT